MLGFRFFQASEQWALVAKLQRNLSSEAGATAVEYSLLLALIASAIVGVVAILGGQLLPGFQAAIDGF